MAVHLNSITRSAPSTKSIIRPIFHVVDSCPSSIYSTASSHFCAIVAVIENYILAECICSKSNFASFRNMRLRRMRHEPIYVYRERMPRWGWLLRTILLVVWGQMLVASVGVGNEWRKAGAGAVRVLLRHYKRKCQNQPPAGHCHLAWRTRAPATIILLPPFAGDPAAARPPAASGVPSTTVMGAP